MKKRFIGAHVSIAGGLNKAVKRANALQATAFSLFTKNQLQWKENFLSSKIIESFLFECKKYNYSPEQILPHSSYLINLGHPIDDNIWKSRISLLNEVNRCKKLGLNQLVFHPGSHLKKIKKEECLIRIADSINIILEKTCGVSMIIENTAGQGSNLGFKFEHLATIIEKIEDKSRIGVCFDSCHAFSSGYDLRTELDCINTFKKFSEIIGLKYLRAIHLNDSKSNLGSRVDRHHNLSKGKIGNYFFHWIMSNKKFNQIPMILETNDKNLWKKEIAWLFSLEKN